MQNFCCCMNLLHMHLGRILTLFITYVQHQDEGRSKVRESLAPSTGKAALQRILPLPCKRQYTVVILLPQKSQFRILGRLVHSGWTNHLPEAKVGVYIY